MADVIAVRNKLRLQNWMEIIRECQESGQTNKEFYAWRGISEKTEYAGRDGAARRIRGA